MLAHTPRALAPYARINIFLAIISIPHARKNFKKNIKHCGFEILDCVLPLYPKMPVVKSERLVIRYISALQPLFITLFVFYIDCYIFTIYTYSVFQTAFTTEKRRFFAVFRIFIEFCNTYRVLCRFAESRQDPIIFQNFVRCPSQSRLSNPRCRIPSYTTIATELDKLSERASLTIGIRIHIS